MVAKNVVSAGGIVSSAAVLGSSCGPDVTAGAATDVSTGTEISSLCQQIPVKDAVTVAVGAGIGYGFYAYAVNIYGLLLPSIMASLAIGSGAAGVIGSLFLIGYTVGTIGFGIAADRYGRKDTLGLSIVMYGVTTALGGLWSNVIWFTAMRFLTGVGGAGELAVGAPYTCEMFRTRYRSI